MRSMCLRQHIHKYWEVQIILMQKLTLIVVNTMCKMHIIRQTHTLMFVNELQDMSPFIPGNPSKNLSMSGTFSFTL